MSDKKQYTVILPAELYERLSALAKAAERTISAETRMAIHAHLRQHEDSAKAAEPIPGQTEIPV